MVRKVLCAQDEVLTILMEECGELFQACSKSIRRGEFNSMQLSDEIGDVMTLINIAHEYDMFSWDDVLEREEVKREKLKTWSNLVSE